MRMDRIVKTILFTPNGMGDGGTPSMGLPALFWGEPATVKTAIIERVCREWSLSLYTLSPGSKGEGAFGVVPVPCEIEGVGLRLTYPMPDWVDKFTDGRGVLFLDEMVDAPPPLQPALHGLLQFGDIGSGRLPPGVRRVAASNPPECSTTGQVLKPAVASRVMHFDADAGDAQAYGMWLVSDAGDHPVEQKDGLREEKRVLAAWPEPFARWRGVIAAFVRARSPLMHALPKPEDPRSGRAWPNRRTWTMAARALAGADVHGLTSEERFELVSGAVGEGPTTELISFTHKLDLPEPADVLDGKVSFKHNGDRADRTMAVLSSCAALLCGMSASAARSARGEKFWSLVADVSDTEPDLIVVPGSTVCAADGGKGIECQTKGATKVLARLDPILASMGITGRR